jgi:hypothetical protein
MPERTSRERRSTFFKVRVSVLLFVLVAVSLYAVADWSRRRARNDWTRPLLVGLVLVEIGPVEDRAVSLLRERVHTLEAVLAAEAQRYGGRIGAMANRPPFGVMVFGPVVVKERPPTLVGDGLSALVEYSISKWRYVSALDRAANVDGRGLDARIYLVAHPAGEGGTNFVEGVSESGGRTGFVEVNLDESMVDFALFVFAHELFHTLGATDKYDERGYALVPAGLADPDLVPLYPQRRAELMARGRPLAPGREVPPETIDELGVGSLTASEIGWTATRPGAQGSP